MKKRNVATAMAAAMAFGGVAPVVANANEPQSRAIVDSGKTIDVALTEGKKVTTGRTYETVYNINSTLSTKDDTMKEGLEVLFTTGVIGKDLDTTTAEFLIAEEMTKAELDKKVEVDGETKTNREIVEAAKADLEDTIAYIKSQLALTYKNKEGKESKVYKLEKKEITTNAVAEGTKVEVTLKPAADAPTVYQEYKVTFANIALEAAKPVPTFGVETLDLAVKSDVTTLNKWVYELKNASDIAVKQEEELVKEGGKVKSITLNLLVSRKSDGAELGTIKLENFDKFKESKFEGFVDLAEMKDLAELDLPELSYAKDAIMDALVTGKLQGDERGFRPKDSITRAEFAKMLVELANVPVKEDAKVNFADVNKDDWFYGYVAGLSDLGIVEGDERGFRPNDAITRQEAAVMIAAMKTNKVNGKHSKVDAFDSVTGKAIDTKTTFKDDASIELWADGAVKYLQDNKISTGDENKNFNPANNITRAESVVMINRAAGVTVVAAPETK